MTGSGRLLIAAAATPVAETAHTGEIFDLIDVLASRIASGFGPIDDGVEIPFALPKPLISSGC